MSGMLTVTMFALTVLQQPRYQIHESPYWSPNSFSFSNFGKTECITVTRQNSTPKSMVLEVGREKTRLVKPREIESFPDGSLRGCWQRFDPFTTFTIHVTFADGKKRSLGPIYQSNGVVHPEQVEKRGWSKGN
jgi:hypothetical protein